MTDRPIGVYENAHLYYIVNIIICIFVLVGVDWGIFKVLFAFPIMLCKVSNETLEYA